MDDKKTSEETERNKVEARENDQELTFEHGYGAYEGIISEGESVEDVAGVSEKDIENDLLGGRPADEAAKQEGDGK